MLSGGLWLATVFCIPAVFAAKVDPSSAAGFAADVKPFLKAHCVACHNGKTQTSGVDFEAFRDPESAMSDPKVWELAAGMLRAGMMPPKGLPRPPRADIDKVIAWFSSQKDGAAARKDDPGQW